MLAKQLLVWMASLALMVVPTVISAVDYGTLTITAKLDDAEQDYRTRLKNRKCRPSEQWNRRRVIWVSPVHAGVRFVAKGDGGVLGADPNQVLVIHGRSVVDTIGWDPLLDDYCTRAFWFRDMEELAQRLQETNDKFAEAAAKKRHGKYAIDMNLWDAENPEAIFVELENVKTASFDRAMDELVERGYVLVEQAVEEFGLWLVGARDRAEIEVILIALSDYAREANENLMRHSIISEAHRQQLNRLLITFDTLRQTHKRARQD